MTKEEIIKNIYKIIIQENGNLYKDLFSSTDVKNVKDPYWKEALSFYGELSNGNKDILFKIIEQIQVDTVSNLLGMLDGTVGMEDDIEFNVSIEDTGEVINGDLQDLFLEYDEETRS